MCIVLAAAIFARRQVEQAKYTRHAQIFTDFLTRWDGEDLLHARHITTALHFREGDRLGFRDAIFSLADAYDRDYFVMQRVPNFFEDLGLLEREGVIPLALIRGRLEGAVRLEFWRWELVITLLRLERKDDQLYVEFERLTNLLGGPREPQ